MGFFTLIEFNADIDSGLTLPENVSDEEIFADITDHVLY
jgi:hypothetical protein